MGIFFTSFGNRVGHKFAKRSGKKNSLRVAQVLIANGADPNVLNGSKETSLFHMCGNGDHDLPFIKFLLASGADLNIGNSAHTLPLEMVITNARRGTRDDRLKVIRLLIENGANVNARSMQNNFDCPIAAAIMADDSAAIELLVEYGLDVSLPIRTSQYGNTTPLDYARMYNKGSAEKTLLKYGAKASRTAK